MQGCQNSLRALRTAAAAVPNCELHDGFVADSVCVLAADAVMHSPAGVSMPAVAVRLRD